ncbi:MAG: hypothetical protein Q4C33_01350 [bacterium]|nr:hypothetical protein [bacterium]
MYDLDANIRDLYPIEMHFENKQEKDINYFKELDRIILLKSKKINRRVIKKRIIYKKNKTKSILAFVITKFNGVKMFTFNIIEEIDAENKFKSISKKNRQLLEKCIKIQNDNDFEYVRNIIDKYLDKVLE